MLPAIIIGIGGTGKWVVTDVKKGILEANEGRMPDNIVLLAFDLTIKESPVVERLVFEKGEKKRFSLDFERGEEFLNFSTTWALPIFEIANGKGEEFPYIYKWLKEDDAKSYNLSPSDVYNTDGAGQRRQSSRDSLFLRVNDVYSKIKGAINRVRGTLTHEGGSPTQKIQIFLINSLAGGTGCGTFLDFIYLIHKAISESDIGIAPVNITTFLLIPKGFEAIANEEKTEISMESMEKNCFAAFRELQRRLFAPLAKIDYNDDLKDVSTVGGTRPIDMCYLIDGTLVGGESGSKVKHFLGTCPAIADYILLHLNEETSPSAYNANVIMHIGEFLGANRDTPNDAPIFSTFGIYRYIFDIEEVIQTFAHKLAREVLAHFLAESPVGEARVKDEVQNFLGSIENTPFNRNLVKSLTEGGDINPTRDTLFSYLKLGTEDLSLPTLRLDDIPTKTIINRISFDQVERAADSRVSANLGKESDFASPRSAVNSYYGVLNYYAQRHYDIFTMLLKAKIIDILKTGDRKGNLDHSEKFLGIFDEKTKGFIGGLIAEYEKFLTRIRDRYDKLNIPEKIKQCNDKLNELKTKDKQKEYLKERVKRAEYEQQELVMKYVEKIAQAQRDLCFDFWKQIKKWQKTFNEGISRVDTAFRAHTEVRMDKKSIKVHEYITEPNDDFENKLYQLIFAPSEPEEMIERELYQKLPHPNRQTIIETFNWCFDYPEKPPTELCCGLPKEFSPWEYLKDKSKWLEWNYNFINNFLRFGQFGELKERISIMDILALKNTNPDDFALKLERNSSPLVAFSPIEQQRGEIGETKQRRITADNVQVFANWTVTPPGKEFAAALKEKFPNRPPFSGRHQIIRFEAKNFVKIRGFPNLIATERNYRKHFEQIVQAKNAGRDIVLTPIHNFIAERNAAEYEFKLKSILGEDVRCLNPRIVNLLEDEPLIRNLTLAYINNIIKSEYQEGGYKFIYNVSIKGEEQEVLLGNDIVSVFEKLIFLPDSKVVEVRNDIEKKVTSLDQEKAKEPGKYAQELENKFHLIEVDKKPTAENDLKRVMKIILWESAELFKK